MYGNKKRKTQCQEDKNIFLIGRNQPRSWYELMRLHKNKAAVYSVHFVYSVPNVYDIYEFFAIMRIKCKQLLH